MLKVDSLHKQIVALQKIEMELIAEISALKEKLDKQKKQSECLVTDLHRMNEELYQHWLALKDIRVLSNRLGILHKFGKIYEDLAYNDQLFKWPNASLLYLIFFFICTFLNLFVIIVDFLA